MKFNIVFLLFSERASREELEKKESPKSSQNASPVGDNNGEHLSLLLIFFFRLLNSMINFCVCFI